MDVIYGILILIVALVFLASPFLINNAYSIEGAPKIVRTSTIFVSFLSSISLFLFYWTAIVMNNLCGQASNGTASLFGWYKGKTVDIGQGPPTFDANFDLAGCSSFLWSMHDNAVVFAMITLLITVLISISQFRKFRAATNLSVGLYLTISMLFLSLVYILSAFAIVHWVIKSLSSGPTIKT
jgi:hypothetical protein